MGRWGGGGWLGDGWVGVWVGGSVEAGEVLEEDKWGALARSRGEGEGGG
jgi:hypothetical protein